MTTIGYILADAKRGTEEERSALAFLRKRYGASATKTISFPRLVNPSRLPAPRVIWWHVDTSTRLPEEALDPGVIATLRRYVERGGTLLLSLAAAQYVVDLGVESVRPNVIVKGNWQEECWAQGNPDLRGFSSRAGHPIFDGLGVAVYTRVAEPGSAFTAAYYEAPSAPKEGKIIGVEREYMKLNDARRQVVEYTLGKGRILTIGSHFFFSQPSYRVRHRLERFAENCIAYLTSPPNSRARSTHWCFGSTPFEEARLNRAPVRKVEEAWNPGEPTRGIVRHPATANAFDVGGRRILIMGEERRGISEVWVHPVRILSDLAVSFRGETWGPVRADVREGEVIIRPESVTRIHRMNDVVIEETMFGDLTLPAGAVHYAPAPGHTVTVSLSARIDLREMWPLPASATGTLRYGWDDGLHALVVSGESGDSVCVIGCGRKPLTRRITQNERGHRELILEIDYSIGASDPGLTLVFAGSHRGEGEALHAYRQMIEETSRRLWTQARHFRSVLEKAAIIESPGEDFNEGYRQAILSLNRFMASTPGVGTSLMAGFSAAAQGWDAGAVSGQPGYAWYFGRDAVWTSFGLLACGNVEDVRSVLEFLGDHQDLTGKILHEMTTGGHVHFDAADATPLYLILLGRYLRTTNDLSFVRSQAGRMRKALSYCFSTDTDGDHLIENTNVGHGWIEGGTLVPVHTELYLASCWAEALEETASVARRLKDLRLARRCAATAAAVKKSIQKSFWNPVTRSYNFGKNVDGSFRTEETILPAVAMYFGQTEHERSGESLDRFASEKFSSDWGTRIVSKDSPHYHPTGYHYGSVWPLFTGWTSLAEFRNDRPAQGFVHAMNNLLLSTHWSAGVRPDVLHGERMTLTGVCSHHALSESMVVHPLLEGMVGFRPDAKDRRATLRPYFPPDWPRAEVRNLRIGADTLSLTMRRRMNMTSFILSTTSRKPLAIDFRPWLPCGTTIHAIRVGRTVSLHAINVITPGSVPVLPLTLKGELRVTFEHTGGIAVVPPVQHPQPGEESTGLRLIREAWKDGAYELVVEGKGDRQYTLDLITEGRPRATEKAWMMRVQEGRLTLALRFDEGGVTSQYRRKTVRVPMDF